MAADGSLKPALVLLHGLNASGGAWQGVIPLVSPHHQVFAPTAPGHRDGPPVRRRPATVDDLVDWAESYLDEQGLQRPHLVGHSMGGFLAIELARRGRAATVCALAPGGFWGFGDGLRAKTMSHVQPNTGLTRMIRPIALLALKSASFRGRFFQTAAAHGDRVSARRGVEIFDDFLACTVTQEVFSSDDQQIAPLDPLPCPVTVAWLEKDVCIPAADYGPNARERLVGHDPMMDDPELIARTILGVTAADQSSR